MRYAIDSKKIKKNLKWRTKINFMDGLKKTFEWYHKNGQLWMKGNKKEGKMDGFWEFYSANGQLWSKGKYKYGKKDGLWKFFNEDDTLKRAERYKDGLKIE